MSQDTQPTTEQKVEICPVGAQRMPKESMPNREQRNRQYTEIGSMKAPAGTVRGFANRRDGSMLWLMPDGSGFLLDANVVASQCYKYWATTGTSIAEMHAEAQNPEAETE